MPTRVFSPRSQKRDRGHPQWVTETSSERIVEDSEVIPGEDKYTDEGFSVPGLKSETWGTRHPAPGETGGTRNWPELAG